MPYDLGDDMSWLRRDLSLAISCVRAIHCFAILPLECVYYIGSWMKLFGSCDAWCSSISKIELR